jgi:glycolate oxidase iron-sulfur subunit
MRLEQYTDAMAKCSYCGYCQATCPVYMEDLLESHVARARINLIKACLVDKTMPISPRFKEIINRCLLCTNCTQTCPSGVPGDEIITAARMELAQEGGIGTVRKFVLRKVLNQRGLASLLGKAGSLVQKLNLAPRDIPPLASQPFDQLYQGTVKAKGRKRGTVAYFVGCGTNYIYPDTGEDVVKVLTHNGFEVIIPGGTVCCGIPALAEGDLEAARQSVHTNFKILAPIQADAVITDCTSCGMMLKAKAHKILAADDTCRADVEAIQDKIWEVTDFLAHQGLELRPGQLACQFSYHVPCHRGWSPTVKDAPRTLLHQIPGAGLKEMEAPEGCCGAAGTFFMEHRELAEAIRSRKLEDIRSTGTSTVVTQCPVCRFYLAAALKEHKIIHPVSLLAQAYGL